MKKIGILPNTIYWTKGSNFPISKHFNSSEFECKCPKCNLNYISLDLVAKLEAIRDIIGEPLTILSGYRCEAHQQDLKEQGFKTAQNVSFHLLGMAVDISTCNLDLNEKARLIEYFEENCNGIGEGKTFIHVDDREGPPARWTYDY